MSSLTFKLSKAAWFDSDLFITEGEARPAVWDSRSASYSEVQCEICHVPASSSAGHSSRIRVYFLSSFISCAVTQEGKPRFRLPLKIGIVGSPLRRATTLSWKRALVGTAPKCLERKRLCFPSVMNTSFTSHQFLTVLYLCPKNQRSPLVQFLTLLIFMYPTPERTARD
jgi:hypothetical protein